MLYKPDSCLDCPWYGDGLGWVPDEIISDARVFILGQNPGENEEQGKEILAPGMYREVEPRPFLGKTGYQMNTTYLPLAGLERGNDVSVGNVLRCRSYSHGTRTNNMPSGDKWTKVTRKCQEAYLRIPERTEIIVVQGAHAFRALGGQGSIYDWRGYLLPVSQAGERVIRRGLRTEGSDIYEGPLPRVFVTLHLADLNHDPRLRLACKIDWKKVGKILSGEWPRQDPARITKLEWDTAVEAWFDRAEAHAPYVAIDCEWNVRSGRLKLVGLGYPGSAILQWARPRPGSEIRTRIMRLIGKKPIVFHNAKADTRVLEREMGVSWDDYLEIEDTMIAHSKLWVEHPHDLEYVGSIYSDYNKKKHLKHTRPFDYNAGDVSDTLCAWESLRGELSRAPQVATVYRDDVRLVPFLQRAERVGIRLDQDAVRDGIEDYQGRVDTAITIAQSYAGWPINVGSDAQTRHQLLEVESFKRKKKKRTKAPTVDKDAIAKYRGLDHPFDAQIEEEEGVSVPYIIGRIGEGAHPYLEARKLHSASRWVVTNYLGPLLGKARCYPEIETHTQDNHRWSYTRPAVATFPRDITRILVPDEGWPWFGWDWDGIELRIIACESLSRWLLEAIEKNYDIHTLTTCAIFDLSLPPDLVDPHGSAASEEWRASVAWAGKDDRRRHFCKRFRYRLNYGGDPRFCMDIPGAAALGFNRKRLEDAARAIFRQDPDLAKWRERMGKRVLETGLAVDFRGRLRRFFTNDPDAMVRQMLDFGMQAGTQSIATMVFLDIAEVGGDDVVYKWGAHDSQFWGIRKPRWHTLVPTLKKIVEMPRIINGVTMTFPATWKERRYEAH